MRVVAFACAWLLLACAPTPVDPYLVARYAVALQTFNANLGNQAQTLAARLLAASDCEGIDARLVVALVATESGWNPDAVSPAGARGLGQLMPATALALGVNPGDPQANLGGTARHLGRLLRAYGVYGSPAKFILALSAYNAGSGAVARYRGVPPYAETQNYVRRVLLLWRRLAGA